MKDFFLSWKILQTPSAESHPVLNDSKTIVRADQNSQTLPGKLDLSQLAAQFPLTWSHYLRLLKVEKTAARRFYETEALRGGWSVRQLDRQISTLFYERTLASRNKGAMLKKGSIPQDGERLTPEEEIKDPLVLEFLGLKD